ncbi:Uncharacterized protein PECH_003660 [Penicillium ucsense]|uniref:RING-type domain-containing protein n=1 Tax=Penicillium ucsense TaxID=2839758 RepID=A0A8J8W7Z9_9EURO|nr:Uncharacterized protein PECM_001840 [Penicillium ucsense]KAF7737483.1 Uncharacterized protein PECH_003660 [Penicillium ucsense]
MSEDPGVQFMGARSKTSHRSMLQQPGEDDQSPWYRHFHPRRPEMSASRSSQLPSLFTFREHSEIRQSADSGRRGGTVIDLTNEPESLPQRRYSVLDGPAASNTPRPPRFGRNILADVDVVDLEDESEYAVDGSAGEDADEEDRAAEIPSSSPEVQFVRTQPRADARPQRYNPYRLLGMNRGGGYRPPPRLGSSQRELRAAPPRIIPYDPFAFEPPSILNSSISLDYELPSFTIGQSMTRPAPSGHQALNTVAYKQPSPLPEGFARTIDDDQVAVCPNCEWELGTGEGKKQNILVAKACGHVYCGECVEHRSKSKAKKAQGDRRTKPFSKCVVEDCDKQLSAPSAFLRMYL